MSYMVPSDAFEQQDLAPFALRHQLADHPALDFESLVRLIPTLEQQHVYYSVKRMGRGDDFEHAVTSERHTAPIERVLEELPSSNGYVMIRKPEVLAPFAELGRDLVEEVSALVRARGYGPRVSLPILYLFISSPHAVTPFHFDRMSNFLFQIRGTKEITVFNPFDPAVITQEEYEAHIARKEGVTVRWKPEVEGRGRKFALGPGDGVHVPFCSGHFVHNGPELSVSLAIFFSHRGNERKANSLLFNRHARPWLARLGSAPSPLGDDPVSDLRKAAVVAAVRGAQYRWESAMGRFRQ